MNQKEIFFYLSGIFGAFIVLRCEIIKFKDKSMYFGIFLTIIMLIASYGIIIHFKCPKIFFGILGILITIMVD